MVSLLGHLEVELRPAGDDLLPVLDVLDYQFLQGQEHGLVVDKCQIDDSEGYLHLSVLEQVLKDDVLHRILMDLDDDTHSVLVRFIVDIGDAFDLLVLHAVRDLYDQPFLVDLIRDLIDDDHHFTVGFLLEVRPRSDPDLSAAGLVCRDYAAQTVDDTSGWEVGSLDELHQVLGLRLGVVDGVDDRIHDLREVMRRHVCGHTDSDTGRTVDQQVGELGRQYDRFLQRTVEVVHEVHGLLVQIGKQIR